MPPSSPRLLPPAVAPEPAGCTVLRPARGAVRPAGMAETLDRGSPEAAWQPPGEFDGYRLVSSLGRGGMGQVFLAHDTVLERPTALKVLETEAAGSRAARERFLVEARAIARLQHPNVVAIYRVGEVQGRPYLVSEYVPGRSLEALALPLPAAEVLRIGRGLARGLAAAHRRGVLHRDIKPANAILADTGEVKLLDFGLAKLLVRREEAEAAEEEAPPESAVPPRPAAPAAGPCRPEMTAPGTLMGTPAYMAPEAWTGEPTTFRSDVYSLGALLYHLSEGRPPHVEAEFGALQDAVLGTRPPPPAGAASEPGLAEVILRCLEKQPRARYASAEALRDALEALSPEHRLHALPAGNPYRGLHAFEAEHRALFFGRDAEIRGLVERLRTESFVLVAGTSGVGKSSLCRAGLLPRIMEGRLDEGRLDEGRPDAGQGEARAWTVVTLTPGKHPLRALATALAPWLGQDEEALLERVREDWGEVARELRRRRRSAGPLLLFIDQLEELVTLSDPAEARLMADVLESLSAPGPGLRLLATCRGDYLARLGSLPGMGEELTRALYLLRPLSREAIREAATGPAHATQVAFESEALIQTLVDSTARADGALPLLQFALAELWEARDQERRLLTAGALAQLGGVEGALARHADGVLERLLPAQRAAARRALLSLVTLEGTRARRTEAELLGAELAGGASGGAQDAPARGALAALVRGRLLVASEASGGSAYEVAHEALIRSWPTLQRWLEEDAEARVVRERLAVAAAEWERLGRKSEALWSARQLQELQGLGRGLEHDALPARERGFVEASRAGLLRRRRRWGWAAAGLLLLLAAGSVGVRLRVRADLAARVEGLVAHGQAALGQGRREALEAERARVRAFAHFDARALKEGEATWALALQRSDAADAAYARAGQAFESALALAREEAGPRALLADVLLERALLAEARQQRERRDELVARLSLYDEGGARQQGLSAPALLSVHSEPAGAQVRLLAADAAGTAAPTAPPSSSRSEALAPVSGASDGRGLGLRGDPGQGAVLGRTPLEAHALPPGAYVLLLEVAGRAPVRLPVLLERGERRDVRVAVPARLPEGFVYVPAGRFLFGSSADESLRRDFFHAAPLHAVDTGAYLIARHETTYADWIAYLEALPAAQRRARAPRIDTGGFRGTLALEPLPRGGGWQLTVQPGGKLHRVRVGERLRYEEREGGAREQDWLRLPVSGVALADAEAYLGWLSAAGRVPGARLCTELEWERAARGADARDYPHGARLHAQEANFDETYQKRPLALGPDEVGSHPASRSPFGVEDLAGNVWEWTRSSLSDEPVARGGSFAYGRNSARSTNRELVEASLRDVTLGLRVCADPP